MKASGRRIREVVPRTASRIFETTAAPVWQRILGLSAAIPTVSSMLPLAVPISAGVFLFLRSATPWSRWTKLLTALAIGSGVAMTVSGLFSRPGIYVTQVVACVVFAFCLIGFTKVAANVLGGARVLVSASLGTAAYSVIVGWDGSRDFIVLWKYALAFPVAVCVLYMVCKMSTRILPVVVLVILAVSSLMWEYRSFSGVCIATVVAWIFHTRTGSGRWWFARAGALGVATIVVSQLVLTAIQQGTFGESLRSKTEWQLSGGGPAILSGRVEPPLSLAAIVARPLEGWGNPNAIDHETFNLGIHLANSLGMWNNDVYYNQWIRPRSGVALHSILFESWVTGGFLAALFPILLLSLFGFTLFKARGTFYPLVAFVSVQGIWDILFSPWGTNRAALLAASAFLAVLAVSQSREHPVRGPAERRDRFRNSRGR
jgi:hypothetical protein